MEFSLSTLVVGSAIASDATRRIVELYDGELACGQKFLRFSHPGRRCPSFAPPDCSPGERRCQEIFAWPLPAFGRCFYFPIRYVPIGCSFCQVAGYPAAWQYPWHLPHPPAAGRPPGGLSGAVAGGVFGEAFFAEAKRSPELWIR